MKVAQQTLNLTNKFQSMQIQMQQLTQQNNLLQAELSNKKIENERLAAEVKDAHVLIERATEINTSLQHDVAYYQQGQLSNKQLNDQLISLQNQINIYKSQLDAQFATQLMHNQQKQQLEMQIQDLNNAIQAYKETEIAQKQHIEMLNQQILNKQQEINVLDQYNQRLRMQQGMEPEYELEKQVISLQQKNIHLERQINLYEDQIAQLQQQITEFNKILQKDKQQLCITQLTSENTALKEMYDQLQTKLYQEQIKYAQYSSTQEMQKIALQASLNQLQASHQAELIARDQMIQQLCQSKMQIQSTKEPETPKQVRFLDNTHPESAQFAVAPKREKSTNSVEEIQFSDVDLQNDYFRASQLSSMQQSKAVGDVEEQNKDESDYKNQIQQSNKLNNQHYEAQQPLNQEELINPGPVESFDQLENDYQNKQEEERVQQQLLPKKQNANNVHLVNEENLDQYIADQWESAQFDL